MVVEALGAHESPGRCIMNKYLIFSSAEHVQQLRPTNCGCLILGVEAAVVVIVVTVALGVVGCSPWSAKQFECFLSGFLWKFRNSTQIRLNMCTLMFLSALHAFDSYCSGSNPRVLQSVIL